MRRQQLLQCLFRMFAAVGLDICLGTFMVAFALIAIALASMTHSDNQSS